MNLFAFLICYLKSSVQLVRLVFLTQVEYAPTVVLDCDFTVAPEHPVLQYEAAMQVRV